MPLSAQEYTVITALISGILNGYPGGAAILREYIQNSDDAGATCQIFILDERCFPRDSVLDDALKDCQGPALIAKNDGIVGDLDWKALRKIHSSSKKTDENQTGKNGLGFRASYHITENPHILSGRTLMILDPHQEFKEHPGGVSIDIVDEGQHYPDQLAPFASIVGNDIFSPFNGTVFRLPLRTVEQASRSEIKSNVPTSVKEMLDHLIGFASSDMKATILFLKHISKIEVRHIDASGVDSLLGAVEIERLDVENRLGTVFRKITFTRRDGTQTVEDWCFHHLRVEKERAAQVMSERLGNGLGYDIGSRLTLEKLVPNVDIALPLDGPAIQGGLYTLLPLPIRIPGFPVHLNAVFALTPDRQTLKNPQEVGLANSRERFLVEYNRIIFDTWAPVAWANILVDLGHHAPHSKNWDAWPPEDRDPQSYQYNLSRNFIKHALQHNLPIFPATSSGNVDSLYSLPNNNLLLAPTFPAIALDILSRLSITVIQPPAHIFSTLESLRIPDLSANIMSPRSLYKLLCKQFPPHSITSWGSDTSVIVDYLVFSDSKSPPATEYLIDLPIFKTASESPVYFTSSATESKYIIPASETESSLFSRDPRMLSWSCMPNKLRTQLRHAQTAKILNVSTLSPDDVVAFLRLRFQHSDASSDEIQADDASYIPWLVRFWTWVIQWEHEKPFFQRIDRDLYLLPTSAATLRKLSSWVIDFRGLAEELDAENAWVALGVHPIHHDMTPRISSMLQTHLIVKVPGTADFISLLLKTCDMSQQSMGRLSQKSFIFLRESLVLRLPAHYCVYLSPELINKLTSLPIFKARKFDGQLGLTCLSGHRRYTDTYPDYPLPLLEAADTIFVDTRDPITMRLASMVDSHNIRALENTDLLGLAINNWSLQPEDLQDRWSKIFLNTWRSLPTPIRTKLEDLPFVTVNGSSTRMAPKNLIHPNSSLKNLYAGEPRIFPVGQFATKDCLSIMNSLGFLSSELTYKILAERLDYFCSHSLLREVDENVVRKAHTLLNLLNHHWSQSYTGLVVQKRTEAWMPFSASMLISPSQCRDKLQYRSNVHEYCYDKVLKVLADVQITSLQFREALGWLDSLPPEVLLNQLRQTLKLQPTSEKNGRILRLVEYFTCLYEAGHLSESVLEEISGVVRDETWLPISRSGPEAVSNKHALLTDTHLLPPFRKVDGALRHPFLLRIGCTNRPTIQTLISELGNAKLVLEMVFILEEIMEYHPNRDRDLLLLPTAESPLRKRPIPEVYYRDTNQAHLLHTIVDRAPAHGHISRALAEKLGIDFLSALTLDDNDDDDDDDDDIQMSEDLTERIRGFLRDYDPRFAINEFLANADDAKATKFSMLLNNNIFHEDAATNFISPDFQSLNQHPTLIFYNNATLSHSDFIGLRQIGRGGKLDQPHTHGRYGLGALSAYYFTDVLTVISGEFVMILDPSGRALPPKHGQKRTALKRKIVDVARHYPDQLKSFDNCFEFSSLRPRYNGTLFCLPLKASINQKSLDYDMVLRLMKAGYRDLARNAFFFTSLEHITAEFRSRLRSGDTHNLKLLWSITGKRSPLIPLVDQITGCNINIVEEESLTSSKVVITDENWLITTSDGVQIPSVHEITATSLKLSDQNPMTIRLAIRTYAKARAHAEEPGSHLFSTLRLPKTTSLPCHLNARFAISSNRQDVVFYPADNRDQKDPKTAFNTWILREIFPPLYLATLSHLNEASRNNQEISFDISRRRWWLTNATDEISRLAREGLLATIPTTDHALFCTSTGIWSSFLSCTFSKDEPSEIKKFLGHVHAPGFVEEHRHTGVAELVSARTVNQDFVKKTLLENGIKLRIRHLYESKEISSEMIHAVLDYICASDTSASDIVGLPLLFLSSDTLAEIPGTNDAPVYFTDKASLRTLFQCSQFVSDKCPIGALECLVREAHINVDKLTERYVPDLMSRELSRLLTAIDDKRKWTELFWATYTDIPGPPPLQLLETAGFQLFGTRSSSENLTLRTCVPQEVIYSPRITSTQSPEHSVWLFGILEKLDIRVLMPTGNITVDTFLSSRFPDIITNILQYIKSKGAMILGGAILTPDEREQLSKWMSTEIGYILREWRCKPPPIDAWFLLGLPIWTSYTSEGEVLRSATDLRVVPSHIPATNIQRYLVEGISIATESVALLDFLRYCQGLNLNAHQLTTGRFELMTFRDVMGVVRLPVHVKEDDIGAYKIFVKSMLKFPTLQIFLRADEHFIPDEQGDLRRPQDLYDSIIPLFNQALRYTERSSFVHPQFRDSDLLSFFRNAGLQYQVTRETFRNCALAIQQAAESYSQGNQGNRGNRSPDRASLLEMSHRAFEEYQRTLAALAVSGRNTVFSWDYVDNVAFIRPKDIRRQGLSYGPVEPYYRNERSLLVSPSRLVRPSLEPIVWTRRLLFFDEPTDAILAVNTNLGIPNASEVVEHLKALTTKIALDHPGNLMLLSDIKATYKWLNENSEAARESLLSADECSMFLNVDDPSWEVWSEQWCTATELVLNLTYDHGSHKGVKAFLKDYEKLILAAGGSTMNIFERQTKEDPDPESDSASLENLRRSFNEMRKSGELIDLVFVPKYVNDDDAPVNPSDLRGHRCFLAATIPHVRDALQGWKIGLDGETEFQGTPFGAKTLLNYVYTGDFALPTPPESISEEDRVVLLRDLLELLEVANRWNMPKMKDKIQWYIIHKYDMVQKLAYQFDIMMKSAVDHDALTLKTDLEKFESKNGMLLRALQEQWDGSDLHS